MSTMPRARILPMTTAGTQHFIERTYREGGRYQWVRETFINALEAKATRIEFGIEWQAVDAKGIYRRVIADDGVGMGPDELIGFFNTFGGGGKPIGDVHENFGVGSKTSLLPWNPHGMIVVSWKNGQASMIWVMRDPDTGEYGLKLERARDPETGDETVEAVYAPYYDEEHGCDWSAVKPDWIEQHGTVIVLLGSDPTDHTVLGDPGRQEADIKGISSYLNRRIWEIHAMHVTVDELRTDNRGDWPRNVAEGHGPQGKSGPDRRTNLRRIRGARYYIEYPEPTFTKGDLAHASTVTLADSTKIHWFLWQGERPAVQSYAAISGYIATLYRDELYDVMTHQATYRSFGASETKVRTNLWLVIEPPQCNGKHGVYPRTDRNSLLLKGGPNAGGPLPILEWAGQFADQCPQPILDAINAARGDVGGSIEDSTWLGRLIERFGSRWRIPKLRVRKRGPVGIDPTQTGTTPKVKIRVTPPPADSGGGRGGTGGRGGDHNIGRPPGSIAAAPTKVAGGLPRFRPVSGDELPEGILAAWQPNDPVYKEGAVLINCDHPVLVEQIEHWQSMFAVHHEADIEHDVIQVYGELGVAKVAHSEHLKGILPAKIVDDKLRSDESLTMSLLGLMAEDTIIATRLGGKYRKRPTSGDSTPASRQG